MEWSSYIIDSVINFCFYFITPISFIWFLVESQNIMKPFSNICELEDNVQEINIHEEVTFEASDKNENATTTTIEGPHDLLLQARPKS